MSSPDETYNEMIEEMSLEDLAYLLNKRKDELRVFSWHNATNREINNVFAIGNAIQLEIGKETK